ncbi:MAG: hypothetical protein Q4C05_03675 [Akkermansia sp.]|nr:hypothetical protein [Akkermansia sp.]
MNKPSTDTKEEALVTLLASLKKEPTYTDDFEDKFLCDFHARKETDAATQSTWELLLERLDDFLQNFSGWKWIYGSMGAVTLIAVGFIVAASDFGTDSNGSHFAVKSNSIVESATLVSEESSADEEKKPTDEENKDKSQDSSSKSNQTPTRVLMEM